MAYIVGVKPAAGERPGKGTYRCMTCNWRVVVEKERDPLPPCGGDCTKEAPAKALQARYERVL